MKHPPKNRIIRGDCLEVMGRWPDGCIDAIVTDPPYGLTANKKGGSGAASMNTQMPAGRSRIGTGNGPGGFMGMAWDRGVPPVEVWVEALRVLKPGGHLLAFGGTRTCHRMVCAIEDAGFEIRDQMQWIYGNGFPKSLDVGKAIDKEAGATREVVGLNRWDGRRTEGSGPNNGDACYGQYGIPGGITIPVTDAAKQWDGWGTALKPAHEPICVARKPFKGTVAANVLTYGTGALNIDGCRVAGPAWKWGTQTDIRGAGYGSKRPSDGDVFARNATSNPQGRWPANVILDEEAGVILDAQSGVTKSGAMARSVEGYVGDSVTSFLRGKSGPDNQHGDSGGASRFFYSVKYSRIELLLCRAKAIMRAWSLVQGGAPCSSTVNTAETNSTLSSEYVASVLGGAVIAASLGAKQLSDLKGLSTSATASECETLCETLIATILSLESAHLRGLWQEGCTPNGCHVNVVEAAAQTDTTTITISLPKSDGSAAPVTFSITPPNTARGEAGSVSRFSYCAKASRKERNAGLSEMEAKAPSQEYRLKGTSSQNTAHHNTPQSNHHPTVKPLSLMAYLVRLVTPPGGIVLDPFAGSGSTCIAAKAEGFNFVGIELSQEYCKIARLRVHHSRRNRKSFMLKGGDGNVQNMQEVLIRGVPQAKKGVLPGLFR